MNEKKEITELLTLLPYFHYKIERPIKHLLKNSKISFETYYCLKILSKNDAVKMTDLSLFLHMSKQQTTKMINGLYEYGFVTRLFDPKDRRIIKIKITEKALQYFIDYEEKLNDQFLQILKDQFKEEDIQKLYQIIQELNTVLQKK